MEYWDLYDYNGKKKKKIAIRGSKLKNDEFHLVINAWILNDKGEFLITQRTSTKSHPLMWECTGGSALVGETPIKAAIREIKEELGIDINEKSATLVGTTRRFYNFCPDILSVFLFKSNISIDEVTIQKEEVNDVMWATPEMILDLFYQRKFEANSFFYKIVSYYNRPKIYYIGFNANNAICNESFLTGTITINPNNEQGNIYFSTDYVEKNDKFLSQYQSFIEHTLDSLLKKYGNVLFIACNSKVKDMLVPVSNKYNVISRSNDDLIKNFNNKKFTRNLLKNSIPIIDTILIDDDISYEKATSLVMSNTFVMQGINGSGGNDTFLINEADKFNKYKNICSNNYFLSKYIRHLPVNITIIIGKYDTVKFPISVQLISLTDDKFKYVGADFIYSQFINKNVIEKIDKYSSVVVDKLKSMNYQGIIGIDYIIDDNDNVYFMEINPRYQSSSFMISTYLERYSKTSIAELDYLAITNQYMGNIYINKIDNSFLNCYKKSDFSEFKHFKIVNNGYYKKNKHSYFRKVFNYSLLEIGNFQKRSND